MCGLLSFNQKRFSNPNSFKRSNNIVNDISAMVNLLEQSHQSLLPPKIKLSYFFRQYEEM